MERRVQKEFLFVAVGLGLCGPAPAGSGRGVGISNVVRLSLRFKARDWNMHTNTHM